MIKAHAFTLGLISAIGMLGSQYAAADIVLLGTRIVYKEAQKEAVIRMENKGERPLLVQAWLDTGDDNADPSTLNVPFTVVPPVSRIEAKRGQTAKITYTGNKALAKDRETVYWFNALEIPPKVSEQDAKGKNLLQLAFRTRIKLFYRPDGLEGSAAEAPSKLTWRAQQKDGHLVIHMSNPTPYFVSFNSINIISGGKKYEVQPSMSEPKSEMDLLVKGLNSKPTGATLEYHAISDFGGGIKGKANL
ncbi:fimbrial chaperone [Salmonella enterica]|nr:fimbrial chaperone [Salmonella enterica]EGL0137963.1 fimbrial chaperone [Salmonella enterica]